MALADPECGDAALTARSAYSRVPGSFVYSPTAPLQIEAGDHEPRELTYVLGERGGVAAALGGLRRWQGLASLLVLAAVASACLGARRMLAARARLRTGPGRLVEMAEERSCGLMEENVEYHPGGLLRELHRVTSPEMCCSTCEGYERCGAWVWGKARGMAGLTDVCFLHELADPDSLTKLPRHGVVSGLPSPKVRKHGRGVLRQGGEPTVVTDALKPGATCPGKLDLKGVANVSVVSARWSKPGNNASSVEVVEGSWIVPHIGSRGYMAEGCAAGSFNSSRYIALQLLGKTLRYTTDMSGAGCGCQAAVKLVPLAHSKVASDCSDYYCDARSTCGVSCSEVNVQEANQYAWSSNVHVRDDEQGVGVGYVGGDAGKGHHDWTSSQYAPGGKCIDTSAPFEVAVSFPVDSRGELTGLEVSLSQSGRSCPLAARLREYRFRGRDGLAKISELLRAGVTPVVSYHGSSELLWLDGLGSDGRGPCVSDAPGACAATVRFYGFSVESLGALAPRARPSALARSP
eukprot:CAMPEP_0168397882 /NCGR_PEP_ID=MMETSP0228-20121227/21294_1 /TAXON_ID=133427 /ORGANISM="Protoceratium reticulatum, Strain CCCM 535 (=CCMP 1889)" /LENGTH=518 /DNA_ID=CAMNT_0008411371 /DNA_START=59 /DNA_END=1611 /DNA_ORIENTATION=+